MHLINIKLEYNQHGSLKRKNVFIQKFEALISEVIQKIAEMFLTSCKFPTMRPKYGIYSKKYKKSSETDSGGNY